MITTILAARIAAVALAVVPGALVLATLPDVTVAPVSALADTGAAKKLVTGSDSGAVSVRGPRTPCVSDEGSEGQPILPCVWDARHAGNGAGRSFVMLADGTVRYVSHRRAHALTFGGVA